jgi:two-component system chemotaxis response regulator CheY
LAKNVLIVDDTAFMRMMLKKILSQNGFNVVGEAGNGIEAIELYQELEPDIVTMDITMPKMDGITAITKIREQDPNALIIVCSAMGQKQMVIQALSSGAKDFIVKPFEEERVIEALGKALEG